MLAHALEYCISSINQTLLQDDINALFDYGNSWQLFFNNTKCAHLHFQVHILLLITSIIIMEMPKKTETKI